MNGQELIVMVPAILGAGIFGGAFGWLYFVLVRRTVARFVAGDGWMLPAAMTLGRVAGAILVFAAMAKLGALPLLAALAGFLVVRRLSVGRAQ